MRAVTGDVAEQHGLGLRDYIVLSALDKSPGLTQSDLGRSLGLDKTTLMSQLDRLEGRGLVVRRSAPSDRRLRIPVITAAGERLRATVADACAAAEAAVLEPFGSGLVDDLRRLLVTIIGDAPDRGSCL
jgi:MarR family transcriptional regulator, organic hydroperoxide resistance regulator